jgi:protein-L-isoaspartate(D-aspartate) O-methyltransferase
VANDGPKQRVHNLPRMSVSESDRLRQQLVDELARGGLVRDERVERAFLAVPREIFVPEFAAQRGLEAVYRDEAIVTKRDAHGTPLSSSSQPAIMASMLERLDLREGQSVLEIGAGSGYNAALLAEIVGPQGRVVSVELDPELAKRSRSALRRAGSRARVVVGDGHDGWAPQAPYDRIIVTASASEVPRAWLEQTVEGGLIEVPLQRRANRAGRADRRGPLPPAAHSTPAAARAHSRRTKNATARAAGADLAAPPLSRPYRPRAPARLQLARSGRHHRPTRRKPRPRRRHEEDNRSDHRLRRVHQRRAPDLTDQRLEDTRAAERE